MLFAKFFLTVLFWFFFVLVYRLLRKEKVRKSRAIIITIIVFIFISFIHCNIIVRMISVFAKFADREDETYLLTFELDDKNTNLYVNIGAVKRFPTFYGDITEEDKNEICEKINTNDYDLLFIDTDLSKGWNYCMYFNRFFSKSSIREEIKFRLTEYVNSTPQTQNSN